MRPSKRDTICFGIGAMAGLLGPAQSAIAAPLSRWERDGEAYLGSATARLLLLEYGSLTCSHCRAFHLGHLGQLKRDYFDRGTVRYVFRPLLTPPIALDAALHTIVNRTPAAHRYDLMMAFFERQPEIIAASMQAGGAMGLVASISAANGGPNLAAINQFLPTVDPTSFDAIGEEAARLYNVNVTPSLLLNGILLPPGARGEYNAHSIGYILDAALERLAGMSGQ